MKFFDKKIFVGTKKGKLIALDESFKIIKESEKLDGAITDFVLWKNSFIVLGTVKGTLYALDRRSLNIVDQLNFGFSGTPYFNETSIDESFLSVMSSRNRLHLIK